MNMSRPCRYLISLPRRLLAIMTAWLRGLLLSVRAWGLFLVAVIVILVVYYALSDRYTPFTTDGYVQAYVVQVAARVEGQVVRVHVRENETVQKDELLFEIDPRPYEHRVAHLEAKLSQATHLVEQMRSDLAVNRAEEARIVAEETYAQAVFRQEEEIYKQQSTTERRYLDALQKYRAAQALREKTRASVQKAEQALAAKVGNEHAIVAEVRAQLAEARLNLEWTRICAPANGYVTNVQLREGSYAHAGKPVLTCIDTDQWWIVANYRENCLERLRPGQHAELSFNTYPGRIFPGQVESVGWGVGEGQATPSGDLPAVKNPAQWIRQAQRFQVRIKAEVPADHPLRVGATVTATAYTEQDHWLNPVAEAWHKAASWLDYLY